MSEVLNEFEQMLEESLKTIRTGEIVTGKVIDVKEDEIVLNIGLRLRCTFCQMCMCPARSVRENATTVRHWT